MVTPKRAQTGKPLTQPREHAYSRPHDLPSAQERIRQKALEDKGLQFTTLWHHIYNIDQLRQSYYSLKRHAAPGLDEVTWQQYGKDLEGNLLDLSKCLQRGAYRAKPVRRTHVPKADGSLRPIGILVLEDKIVQRATVEVLNSIYETDFKGFSYGFRPKRSQHNALDALSVGIEKKKVSWVLDADIRGFFDAIDHAWLIKFIEHRIADQRVVRQIRKWLKAGVLEDGKVTYAEDGTPQGGSISPLLANIFLHYVFDLWADKWRKQAGRGDVIIVRYADDIVVGFQYRNDAEQFQQEMTERLGRFKLELHAEKTRLIEFGRFAADNRKERGEGKPETFNFLGFTHMCGKTRKGRFTVLRQTIQKKMLRKLQELKVELRKRMHWAIPEVGKWLKTVLLGHYRYYGVPNNTRKLSAFRYHLRCMWALVLRRRSQRQRMTWERMEKIAIRWLPPPRIYHPYPTERLRVTT
jgi:group II intron reverse transcriptase/maturase